MQQQKHSAHLRPDLSACWYRGVSCCERASGLLSARCGWVETFVTDILFFRLMLRSLMLLSLGHLIIKSFGLNLGIGLKGSSFLRGRAYSTSPALIVALELCFRWPSSILCLSSLRPSPSSCLSLALGSHRLHAVVLPGLPLLGIAESPLKDSLVDVGVA